MGQVTEVNQLRDVAPNHWAYTALNDLIQRYNCLQGYPNNTFQGQRPLNRYEFAAGLNACANTLETLLTENADIVTRADLDILRRLTQEFEAELATLDSQINNLESRVNFLSDSQFSTTTKLYGQVVMGLQGRFSNSADAQKADETFGRDGNPDTPDPNDEISFGYNAQLTLLTQFNPRSFLLTGIQAGNLNTSDFTSNFGLLNNNFTRLGYESNTNNGLILTDASYRQLVTDNLAMIVGPAGVNPVSVFRGPSRVESAGFGPLSRFAQRNPIKQIGATTAGIGFDWQPAQKISLQGLYAVPFANTSTAGLFNDSYIAGVQAFLTPTETIDVALYYLNSYSGSNAGRLLTGVGDSDISSFTAARFNTDAFGATVNWAITEDVTLGGWVGFTTSRQVNFAGSVQTNNWMVSLQFPDLFAEGNYGGIFFGVPPRITESNLTVDGFLAGNLPSIFEGNLVTNTNGGRRDSTYHLEAFYRSRLSRHITLTPGAILLFNPGHNAGSDPILIVGLRTTFSF
ncbi:iron uptake porin [Spirulina sp. CS-785/01]|uniref:iron uptake porin n=1 Tax=Spirulina sp. CS-785/01 TaxID=3021716 RepID=UPI00232A7F52|nr:iron uptake porin [Spirulina sp. CS-785/01]MDB9311817.1 iron uptake porin [Spirulina sp. CS-785/01]